MFTELMPILEKGSLTVQLSLVKGKVSVLVVPKTPDAALNNPISLVGTAEELDAQFCAAMNGICTEYVDLATMVEQQKEILRSQKVTVAKASVAKSTPDKSGAKQSAPVANSNSEIVAESGDSDENVSVGDEDEDAATSGSGCSEISLF